MKWGGRRAQAWSRAVLDRYGRVCQLRLDVCTDVATTGDHVIPKSVRPDLAYDVTNGRPACRPCNSSRNAEPLPRVQLVDDTDFFETANPRGSQADRSPPRAAGKNRAGQDGARP